MDAMTLSAPEGMAETLDWEKGGGLLPMVVQHFHDGRVLMLGYCDREALDRTLASGEVHFFSRSRSALWRKGETSGNVLRAISIAADCDRDSLLCQALPAGPTCHRGTASCFDGEGRAHPWLNELEALIGQRRTQPPDSSYVARLFAAGTARMAQKVGEEGVETALAAVAGPEEKLGEEAADLLFHLLVLLADRGLGLADIAEVLAQRHR